MVLGPQAGLAPRADHRVVTNSERADQLLADADAIAGEMRSALALHRWNLAVRRAQEVIELVAKGLINEMGVEYPRTHDPVPALIDTIRQRRVDADQAFLDRLRSLSRELADLRGPAFYQEIALREDQASGAVDGAEKVLRFGRVLVGRLRGDG